jgi:hypothetical protein
MDIGRQHDLEELEKARKNAKSLIEREIYEEIIYRVKKEAAYIGALRQKLILAIRADDKPTVERVQNLIQMIQLNSTYGKSWGNNKGNRSVR